MKKLILTVFAIVVSFGTVTASDLHKPTFKTSIEYPNVSTFCKLIKAGNFEAVKAMIENGTNINRKSTGLTPLMFAARYNKVEIVKLLISKGAKLNTKSERGSFTALQYAKMSKAHEAYKIIKEAMDK
ncbi:MULTISPECIES: ankyrin repeat domain-containing protein [unclassified Tenacibaculum]|uniref:ankyrin repeat domain-containing protein n=1 Tax=unclassified Tenacibaculum TaxID=2635139 RepID=UPI001F16BC6D|nr:MULTISPECIES: ankyrin repeat domain-containing protein [unclassified Tenacibaculum]MCF2874861.1 ankyrin repeat domain-containing protein [Tenacibaculum sp. Cn5-1]MCF2934073.1 ankyrin repeat domain-containing protein [Tenacibaculum sp. Cn5-34]MCG7510283.1 ankyrin repeat domain-containing protein [Tenacibaculum sp. Cn5-46]